MDEDKNEAVVERVRQARNRASLVRQALDALDARPPVDEAQVEALADLLRMADREGPDTLDAGEPEHFARRLVERGVRVEVKS